jgi:hypothetical protein
MIDYYCTLWRSTNGQPLLSGCGDPVLFSCMWLSLKVPDKASLLSHPSITIHRYRLCATVSPAEKSFESELRGWRDDRPQTHGEPQASVRATGILVNRLADPESRHGYPPYRYKRVTALRMRAWRWHGGPSMHIRHTNLQASVGSEHCYEHDYWQRYGHRRASLGFLERHPGESERNERKCGTTVPNQGAQRDTLGQSLGRAPTLSVSRVARRLGSS